MNGYVPEKTIEEGETREKEDWTAPEASAAKAALTIYLTFYVISR